MRKIYFIFVIILFFNSCSDKSYSPIDPNELGDLVFSTLTDTVEVFPYSYKQIEFLILEGTIDPTKIESQNFDFNNFQINGPWLTDTTNKKISFNIWGSQVSSSPESVTIPVEIDSKTYHLRITVYVSELYLIDRFETNVLNDTIVINEGSNFLLNITCIDSANNMTPKSIIEKLGFGIGYGYWQNDAHLKFVVTSVNRDSIHYSYMFAAFSDISPDNDDRYLSFSFNISGKGFALPVKIIYN